MVILTKVNYYLHNVDSTWTNLSKLPSYTSSTACWQTYFTNRAYTFF